MLKRSILLVATSLLLMALTACGGGGTSAESADGEPTPVGDAANGELLFAQPLIGANTAPGCITCHSLQPDFTLVGPSMAAVATRAETRVSGQTAEQYIRNSILHPDDFVVENFAPGSMYQNYSADLTTEEVDDLVAYGLTLK